MSKCLPIELSQRAGSIAGERRFSPIAQVLRFHIRSIQTLHASCEGATAPLQVFTKPIMVFRPLDAIVAAFTKHLRGEVDSFIPDEYDSSMGFDAVRAMSIGRDRGSGYVLIGNCIEFYRVAPMTYRVDRGGIEVQIVRVSDGQRVFQASEIRNTGTNFSTPKDAIGVNAIIS